MSANLEKVFWPESIYGISQWRLYCLRILLTPDPPPQFNSWACFFDLTTNLPMGFSPMRAWIMKPLIVSPAPFPWILTSIDSFWSELNWFFDKINLYGASDACGWINWGQNSFIAFAQNEMNFKFQVVKPQHDAVVSYHRKLHQVLQHYTNRLMVSHKSARLKLMHGKTFWISGSFRRWHKQ